MSTHQSLPKKKIILTPNLQLDLFSIDSDHPRTKLDADCEIVDGLEAFVSKLEQQTRLSDT